MDCITNYGTSSKALFQSPKKKVVKPMNTCNALASNTSCVDKKIITTLGESDQMTSLEILSKNSLVNALDNIKLCSRKADFKCLDFLVNIMIGTCPKKEAVPDEKFWPLALAHCEGFLRLHPPCGCHTWNCYLELLSQSDRFFSLVKKMLMEVQLVSKNVMPLMKRPRKENRRYSDETTPDIVKLIEEYVETEANIKTKDELYPKERLSFFFTTFSFFVSILESDIERYMQHQSVASKTSRSALSPLLQRLFWNNSDWEDSSLCVNDPCHQIFQLYVQCWHNGVDISYLKVISKLIGLLGEFIRMTGQLSLRQLMGAGVLDDINGNKQPSSPTAAKGLENVYENCAFSFAEKFSASFNEFCSCEKKVECTFTAKALLFVQPAWMQFYVATFLLGRKPLPAEVKKIVKHITSTNALGNASIDLKTKAEEIRSIQSTAAISANKAVSSSYASRLYKRERDQSPVLGDLTKRFKCNKDVVVL